LITTIRQCSRPGKAAASSAGLLKLRIETDEKMIIGRLCTEGNNTGKDRGMKTPNSGNGSTQDRGRTFLSLGSLLIACVLFTASCSKTARVYYPPNFDLNRYERLGIISFADNAKPSVSSYATQQFQDQIHSAQTGTPILQLGDEKEVLRSIDSDRLDFKAFQKIGRMYDVAAVFCGNVLYSDIKADVQLKSLRDLRTDVNTTLHATLSVQLYETAGGAAVWSDSVSWKRRLGAISADKQGNVSAGMSGYHDAYRKLIPDMAYDVTREFRGRYVQEKIADNASR
jgi:hypothetical protein